MASSSSSSSPPAGVVVEDPGRLAVAAQAGENNASSSKTVVLISSDGLEIEVGIPAASLSKTLNRILEDYVDDDVDGPIPLKNINSSVLGKVLEYCNKYVATGSAKPAPLKEWDAEYVKGLVGGDLLAGDLDLLRQVLLAAHFLEIDGLLLLLVKATADQIKTKMPPEIRRRFKIEKDFTPEQWEEVRKEHGWAWEEWDTEA